MQYNSKKLTQVKFGAAAPREDSMSRDAVAGESKAAFLRAVGAVAAAIGERPLDEALARWLNSAFPQDGPDFRGIAGLIAAGDAEGWLCARESGGVAFGRVVRAGADAGRFSVDVVRMEPVAGPHHVHPQGEIGMIVPIDGAPAFDGFPPGWYVYGAGSDHHPTVTGGRAYVLYLLPDGAITFTGR
mgnify:FL=1